MSYAQAKQLCPAPFGNHGQGNRVLDSKNIHERSLTHGVEVSMGGYHNISTAYKVNEPSCIPTYQTGSYTPERRMM